MNKITLITLTLLIAFFAQLNFAMSKEETRIETQITNQIIENAKKRETRSRSQKMSYCQELYKETLFEFATYNELDEKLTKTIKNAQIINKHLQQYNDSVDNYNKQCRS